MNPIIVRNFEGKPLTTLTWKGRPAWITREIGAALGYANDGKRLVTRIGDEWAEEFIPGHDFAVLTGLDLIAFKSEMLAGGGLSRFTSHVNLLFEPGLHLVLSKTDKPVGVRLRRFLADEVMPQLVRNGTYQPGATATPAPPEAPAHPLVENVLVLRELRLMRQAATSEARLDLEDRRFRSGMVRSTGRLLHELGQIDDSARAAGEITATLIALGGDHPIAFIPGGAGWKTAAEIAHDLGDSTFGVTLAALRARLNGVIPGLCSVRLMPRHRLPGMNVVPIFSPEAARRIRDRIDLDRQHEKTDTSGDAA